MFASTKTAFPSTTGAKLAARLDSPPTPLACAVFAPWISSRPPDRPRARGVARRQAGLSAGILGRPVTRWMNVVPGSRLPSDVTDVPVGTYERGGPSRR